MNHHQKIGRIQEEKDPVSLSQYASSKDPYVRAYVVLNSYTNEETILNIINNETNMLVFQALVHYSFRENVPEHLGLLIRAICLLKRRF